VLLEAKSRYSQFIDKKTGTWHEWFKGEKAIMEQADRQVAAAKGLLIEWHFEEEIVRDLVVEMLKKKYLPIKCIHAPYKAK